MYYPRDDRNGEVRTLFISGLPDDVKEREIHNLFRLVPGYEGCKLTATGNIGPVAFASFTDRNSALIGQAYLHGIKFDPENPITLRIEFAKTNSKTKRLIEDGDPYHSAKRFRTNTYSTAPPPAPYIPAPSVSIPRMPTPDPHSRSPTSSGGGGGGGDPRPPCTTLFVANLDPLTTEMELAHVFGSVPGYKRLRLPLKEGRGRRNAFVEYVDTQAATAAMYSLQGYPIGATQVHIEFAKAPMGEQGHRARERAAEMGDGEGDDDEKRGLNDNEDS